MNPEGGSLVPTISAFAEAEDLSEDATLLTLYSLAGEESGGFVTFRPRVFHRIGRAFFSTGSASRRPGSTEAVEVRELSGTEMARAERELWVHYGGLIANRKTDRIFAVFTGKKIIGVARCSRHHDGLEVDAVYVLEEFRFRGFARSVMQLLLEECGKHETLYLHTKTELVDFYSALGFYPVSETELPGSIREHTGLCTGESGTTGTCPMRRDPSPVTMARSAMEKHV
ncbi:MAG TPA: GNAT family N-acetyltransferase [Methanoregula sp.]|nr:GNAT family N-acetyltransferase [Methanoregula sp.]